MPGAGVLSISEWRTGLLAKQQPTGVTPLEIAATLDANATQALHALPSLQRAVVTPPAAPRNTRHARRHRRHGAPWAVLRREDSRRVPDLALFDKTGDPRQQAAAVQHLEAALNHWKDYAAAYTRQSVQPVLYNRAGVVDIPTQTADVAADVQLAVRLETRHDRRTQDQAFPHRTGIHKIGYDPSTRAFRHPENPTPPHGSPRRHHVPADAACRR